MSRDLDIEIPTGDDPDDRITGTRITGTLALPNGVESVVLLADGTGSARASARNQFIAEVLRRGGFGTLLLDLVTADEERTAQAMAWFRFDGAFLAGRVVSATDWLAAEGFLPAHQLGYLGASTGGAAVLIAAARRPATAAAVVLVGARPDLAAGAIVGVAAPTLLLVADDDDSVLALNRDAWWALPAAHKDLRIIAGASHLFEEPGALDEVSDLAREWFEQFVLFRLAPHPANP